MIPENIIEFCKKSIILSVRARPQSIEWNGKAISIFIKNNNNQQQQWGYRNITARSNHPWYTLRYTYIYTWWMMVSWTELRAVAEQWQSSQCCSSLFSYNQEPNQQKNVTITLGSWGWWDIHTYIYICSSTRTNLIQTKHKYNVC